jgi:hypothetical protein
MQDASTSRQRFLRVTQGFETSRIEKGLLAVAYERAVPIVSRRSSPRPSKDSLLANAAESRQRDVQRSRAMERHVG